jgi:hypothetical protein
LGFSALSQGREVKKDGWAVKRGEQLPRGLKFSPIDAVKASLTNAAPVNFTALGFIQPPEAG